VLKSQTATEKDTITLLCELDEPDGEVQWFKNGEELKQDKRIQIVKEGRKRKVIIKDAKITDAAMYKCTSNADTTEGEIVVDCKSITKITNKHLICGLNFQTKTDSTRNSRTPLSLSAKSWCWRLNSRTRPLLLNGLSMASLLCPMRG